MMTVSPEEVIAICFIGYFSVLAWALFRVMFKWRKKQIFERWIDAKDSS